MRKVFFIIVLVVLSLSVYGISESSLYNASGQGASSFITIDDEEDTMIYMFGSTRSGSVYYEGLVIYVDEDMQPEGIIYFKWFTHRGNLVIEPYRMEVYEDGEVVSEQEGFNNTIRDSVSLFRHGGRTMLSIGDVNLLLFNN